MIDVPKWANDHRGGNHRPLSILMGHFEGLLNNYYYFLYFIIHKKRPSKKNWHYSL